MVRHMKMHRASHALFAVSFVFTLLLVAPQAEGQMTAGKAMDVISAAFRRQIRGKHFVRPTSFRVSEWPANASLLRAERGNLPIFSRPSLTSANLHILGIAHPGEIFQSLGCQQIVRLFNPLGGVDDSGTWCKVRLLNGKVGWLMARGNGQASSFLESIRRPSSPSPATFGWPVGMVAALGLLLLLWKSLSGRKSIQTSYSASSDDSWGDSIANATAPPTQPAPLPDKESWPWHGKQVVVAPRNVYEKGFLIDKKVGHVEKAPLWSAGERIHRNNILTSTEVAKIKEDFLGNPTAIVDKKGHEIGKVKTDWFGDKIIVDKAGKKIGEYKRGKK